MASHGFKQFYSPDDHRMYMMAQADLGVVNCYEPASAERNVFGANIPGYRGEQFVLGDGSVSLKSWTPNALEYDVDARAVSTVVINQNFDPEWQIEKGTGELVKSNGLLAIEVPAGKQLLELRYHSTSFLKGCIIFFIGVVAAISLWLAEDKWHSKAPPPENRKPAGPPESSTETPQANLEHAIADEKD